MKKWWAIVTADETFVLQISHEAREFFPEILGTWNDPFSPKTAKETQKISSLTKSKMENNFRYVENKNENQALCSGSNV